MPVDLPKTLPFGIAEHGIVRPAFGFLYPHSFGFEAVGLHSDHGSDFFGKSEIGDLASFPLVVIDAGL